MARLEGLRRCGRGGLRELERVVAWGVAFELEAGEEQAGGGIGAAGRDARAARGGGEVGQRRRVGCGLLLGEGEVAGERGLGSAVLVGVGLDGADERGNVGGVDGVVGGELGEVVFLVGDVDVEVEVLRD